MKKTPNMLRVEESIGEPLETYLERECPITYVETIASNLGISPSSVRNWRELFNIEKQDIPERRRISPPNKARLIELYEKKHYSCERCGVDLGMSGERVIYWLNQFGVKIRTPKESRLPKDFIEPTNEEIELSYNKLGKSISEIAREFGVSVGYVRGKMDEYGIKRRSNFHREPDPKARDFTKEELEKMYIEEKLPMTKIGEKGRFSTSKVGMLLKKHQIPKRTQSEARLLTKGAVKPTKKEFKRDYGSMTLTEMGEKYKVSASCIKNWRVEYEIKKREMSPKLVKQGAKRPSKGELEMDVHTRKLTQEKIGEKYNLSASTIRNMLGKYEISGRDSQGVRNRKQFIDFLNQDKVAHNLAVAATMLNGEAYDIEQIILETYEGRFKDQSHLHALLEESEREIYGLIEGGLTNLGAYIGKFSLEDRSIIPMLLGEAIMSLPEEKVTPSLEERLVRILRNQYSPRFNTDSEGTLSEIEERVEGTEGKAKTLYEGLREHYQSVLELQEELR